MTLLAQQKLNKALLEKAKKPKGMAEEDWEDSDLHASYDIELCLADEVICNVMVVTTTTCIWLNLESLYMTKSLSNKFYIKK